MHSRTRHVAVVITFALVALASCLPRKSASSGTINVPRVFSATNKIIQYFKSIPLEIRDIELTTPEADWFIVSSYPPSGVGRVEAFCFLKDVVGWELRLAIVLPSAPSMLLECRFNKKTHVLEVFSGGHLVASVSNLKYSPASLSPLDPLTK